MKHWTCLQGPTKAVMHGHPCSTTTARFVEARAASHQRSLPAVNLVEACGQIPFGARWTFLLVSPISSGMSKNMTAPLRGHTLRFLTSSCRCVCLRNQPWEAVPSRTPWGSWLPLRPNGRSFQRFFPAGHGSKVFQKQFFHPKQGASQTTSSSTLAAAYERPATRKGTMSIHP